MGNEGRKLYCRWNFLSTGNLSMLSIAAGLVAISFCLLGSSAQPRTPYRERDVSIGRYKLEIGAPRLAVEPNVASTNNAAHPRTYRQDHRRLVDTAVPETPTDVFGVQILSQSGQVWVRWTGPSDNNITITSYQVSYNRTGDLAVPEGIVNATGIPAPTSVNVTGLSTGAGYLFYVRAVNAVGPGPISVASDEVVLHPGRITSSAVSTSAHGAGVANIMTLNFTCQHAIPSDGYIHVELPPTFKSVDNSAVITPITGISANIVGLVDGLSITMTMSGSTADTPAGHLISLAIEGVTNPPFEGTTDRFVALRIMENDGETPIDEASAEFNSNDRLGRLSFNAGTFETAPIVELERYVAGAHTTANFTFIPSNPIPADGHIIVEFPNSFTSVVPTAINVTGIDGGFNVTVGQDGYTVDIARDGVGGEVTAGSSVSIKLMNGVVNQRFEGQSVAFPLVKTTLANVSVSIDEASEDTNRGDRPASVLFTPAAFAVPPTVTLDSYDAGVQAVANVTLTTSNPLPRDGHIVIEFPTNFTSISTSAVAVWGMDGGFSVSIATDGYTIDIDRHGDGTEVDAGTAILVSLLDGITNQRFEGESLAFPLIKTTLTDRNVSIDEASSDTNSADRPAAVVFTPAAFTVRPTVSLDTYVAGRVGNATIALTTLNPLPADGRIVVEFPREFASITPTTALASGMDGDFIVSVGPDGYTVDVQRDATGMGVSAGTTISVEIDGITNQQFAGSSSVFPLVKTTLANSNISIDEASSAAHAVDRPTAVLFTAGSFAVPPTVTLDSYDAGTKGAANITFTTSNLLPIDGHIVIEFPTNFSSIDSTSTNVSGIDGDFSIVLYASGYTVDIVRDGTGTNTAARTAVSLKIDRITNQHFEGTSTIFPMVKTTLFNVSVSIDEASAGVNSGDRPSSTTFMPGAFPVPPTVTLDSYDAGVQATANVSFTIFNPLPIDGHIMIDFPPEFKSIEGGEAVACHIDGGFVVSMGEKGFTVDIERDGTGTEVIAGTAVSIALVHSVTNQQFEGPSGVFPTVKTTLANSNMSIDEASSEVNPEDRPAAILFRPAAFAATPKVTLDSYIAGEGGAANVTFTTSNPLPADGHIIIGFPDNFTSINPTAISALGMDGGFAVSRFADGFTADIQRDGSGTVVPAGTTVAARIVDGVTNQPFEGTSIPFPRVKTTLNNSDVSIDDSARGDELPPIVFRAGSFSELEIVLQYQVAGIRTAANVSFTTANPLPHTAVVQIEFPSDFTKASPTIADSAELGSLSVNGSYLLMVRRNGSDIVPSGTNVSILVANFINRDTAGNTGSFSVTTYTDESMTNRIDAGVASSTTISKHLLQRSAAYGSSSVAVVAQQKRWTFTGHGVSLGDQLKWVNASATSDEHCAWENWVIDVDSFDEENSTAANIVFKQSSEHTGPLQLCYRFSSGGNPFKLYPEMTLSVRELYGISAAEEGSKSISVVGYPKALIMSGFGVAEFDKARWLLGQHDNCTSSTHVASLLSGGDDGDNSAILTSSHHASFELSADSFDPDLTTGNVSVNATLCYKFGTERFQPYPSISIDIRHLTGWASSVGGSPVAVVGVTESITFTGYGLSAGADTGDRARWILSGVDCYDNAADIAETAGGLINVTSAQASFTFETSASGSSPRLCYWFENEPALAYPLLTIDVAYLSKLSAPSFGDIDVAVVDYTKLWGFAGGHVRDGDVVRWMYNDSSGCSDAGSIAEMAEEGEVMSGETECTFTYASSGRWITPCYRHSNEPWRRYSLPVYVKMVQNMTAEWGNDSACVAGQAKRWHFAGDGLASDGTSDLIKFITNDTDCNSGSDTALSDADSGGIAMYLTADKNATFTIETEAAGRSIFLCYKFGNENYQWYNMSAFVHMLQSIGSRVGGTDITVVDVQEVLVIHANGTSSQDHVRWVVRDETTLDSNCEDNDTVVGIWGSIDLEGKSCSLRSRSSCA